MTLQHGPPRKKWLPSRRRPGVWFAISGLFLLAACSNKALHWDYDTYTVRSGDTLYAIAWYYGIDHRLLARWNRLGSAEVIYPGQKLTLKPPSGTGARPPSPLPASAPRKGEPTVRASENGQRQPQPDWVWPAQGPVIAAFGDRSSVGKGIDIGGQKGQPVLSAADGRVVYAGSGLIGYGQLIIIKHNETYLSAYGHNVALLAGQGDMVAKGQRIAEMGLGPGNTPMLHFEIRVDGVAVDPIRFLPKR